MPQKLLEQPSSQTPEPVQKPTPAGMRYDLIVRCRQAIHEGRYDQDESIDQMLEHCLDDLAFDARSAA